MTMPQTTTTSLPTIREIPERSLENRDALRNYNLDDDREGNGGGDGSNGWTTMRDVNALTPGELEAGLGGCSIYTMTATMSPSNSSGSTAFRQQQLHQQQQRKGKHRAVVNVLGRFWPVSVFVWVCLRLQGDPVSSLLRSPVVFQILPILLLYTLRSWWNKRR